MNKSDILELHFITYIDNVPSIMRQGILSHNRSQERTNYRDISEGGVQDRRATKKIPGTNKSLHDYANLYFDAHNPMLSSRRSENKEICVLRVKNLILDIEGVIVTDKNAARECWFKTVDEGLSLLDKDEVYATYWLHDDDWEQERRKGIKCAEVLVPDCVHSDFIFGAYVANNAAFNKLSDVSSISVITNRNLFF
jgi:hypothetical protein